MTKKITLVLACVMAIAMAAVLGGCGGSDEGGDSEAYTPPTKLATLAPEAMKNVGPRGEDAYPSSEVKALLTDEVKEKIRAGNYTCAAVWYTASPWFEAVNAGLKDMCDELGIEIVATTNYEYDAGRYKDQVETVIAKKPDFLATISADPVAAAAALQPALNAGTKVVVVSNPPEGWMPGKEYVAAVTGNPFEQGVWCADKLAETVGGKGDVGIIFHDASFYVTNLRDQVMKTTLLTKYPDVHIVDEQGFSDPTQAQQLTAAMLTQNPSIKAMYVAWDTVAEGAVAGLRDVGRTDVKIVSMDLGLNNVLNMAQGEQVAGLACEITYEIGEIAAIDGALALIGEDVPAFCNTGYIGATKENIEDSWWTVFHEELPSEIKDAL